MKLFGFTIKRSPAPVSFISYEPLTEVQLEAIFREYSETHPIWRAVLQINDRIEDEANRQAGDDPGDRDSHCGTARQCRLLRDEIFNRRQRARKRPAEQDEPSGREPA